MSKSSTTRTKKLLSSSSSSAGNRPKSTAKSPEKPKPQPNRVFTERDEIRLLKALLRTSRSTTPSLSLSSRIGTQFTEAQIAGKLRRLRRRYHNLARSKSLIKTHHDRRTYEIGRKIWGKKEPIPNPPPVEEDAGIAVPIRENGGGSEKLGLEDFPVLMEEVSRDFPENGVYREGLGILGRSKLRNLNERWMIQKMEEAGIAAKRAQLNYEEIKLAVEAVLGSPHI